MDPTMDNTTTCNNQTTTPNKQQTQYYNTSEVSGYIETESSNCMYYRPQYSFPTFSQYDHKYDKLSLQNYHEIGQNMPSTSSMSSSSPLIPSSIPHPSPSSQSHMSPPIPQSALYQLPPSLPSHPSDFLNPPTLDPPNLRRDTQQNARPMVKPRHGERLLKDKKREKCNCPSCQNITPKYDANGRQLHLCHIKDCEKMFNKTSYLKAHLRWHTGNRSYACHCGKNFHRSDELKRHLRTHTGEKTHQCPKCDWTFPRSDHLKKHMKTHENKKK
ncbi:transcription factor Sp8-like [Odontomachus brunneus]|uniref:transcription factor Sp8-like n=1 Tax=Odontomachus brunneus TaxID=486640 RepID=UPI0013F26CD1|nr:transcription factor Sp8-like [Odontomachus brunneus]